MSLSAEPIPLEGPQAPFAWRRNCALLLSEVVFFFIGFAFLDPFTILPTFLSEYVHSSSWLGAILAFRAVALTLPQLWVSQVLAHRPYAKPFLLTVAGIGRLVFLLFAVWLWFWGREYPHLVFPFFLVAAGTFMLMDGAGWVPWTAMVERSMPANVRAWFFGAMVSLIALGALPTGWIVERVLPRWSFPENYALLYLLCGACTMVSWFCLCGVKEQPREAVYEEPLSAKTYVREVRNLLREDRRFTVLLLALGLLCAYGLSSNFYVLDAQALWQKAKAWVGWYLMAQQGGGVLAGLLWNLIRRYASTRAALQTMAWIVVLIPASALLCRTLTPSAYLVTFFLQGMVWLSVWSVAMTYLMEAYPPDAKQIMRIGALNTLFALSSGLPLLGGLIVQGFSYPALFLITSVATLSGAWLLYRNAS